MSLQKTEMFSETKLSRLPNVNSYITSAVGLTQRFRSVFRRHSSSKNAAQPLWPTCRCLTTHRLAAVTDRTSHTPAQRLLLGGEK